MRIYLAIVGTAAVLTSAPAFAGFTPVAVPAPVAGLGIGAVALLGLGYRALRRTVGR